MVPLVAYGIYVLGHLGGISFSGVGGPLWVSVSATTIAMVISAGLGVPLAFLLERRRGRLTKLFSVVLRLPLGLPPLAAGVIILLTVGPYTLLGRASGGSFVNSYLGVVAAETFVAIPYVIETARAAFAKVDVAAEAVAESLGFRRWQRFWLVTLREAWPGVRTALALGWLRGFGEFGATVLVAYHPYSLPVFTYTQFSAYGVPSASAVVVVTLGAIAVGSAVLFSLPFPSKVALSSLRSDSVARASLDREHLYVDERLSFSARGTRGGFAFDYELVEVEVPLAVMGYTGSGKSLLLSLLGGGTDSIELGEALCGSLGDQDLGALAQGSQVGYIPQSSGLFRGYRVREQLEVVADRYRVSPEIRSELIDHFEIGSLLELETSQLSGGQRQQVALCRALLQAPRLLLIDEGFSAMDMPLRRRLLRRTVRWCRRLGVAWIMVTHDVSEARSMSRSVVVIAHGHLLRGGSFDQVALDPRYGEVAELMGYDNLVYGYELDLHEVANELIACHGTDLEITSDGAPNAMVVALSNDRQGQRVMVTLGSGRDLEMVLPADVAVSLGDRVRCGLRSGVQPLVVSEGYKLGSEGS